MNLEATHKTVFTLFILAALALLVTILSGCANIAHHRTVSVAPDGTRTVQEDETGHFFFEKEVAQKVSITTKDGPTNYAHSFSAAGVSVTGDADLINAIGTQVINGVKTGGAMAATGGVVR